MCGRYGFGNPTRLGELKLGVTLPESVPRFNIGPMQWVPMVTGQGNGRRALTAKWGLVPSWARDSSVGARMCNARGDAVASKPSFRAAFGARRSLLPAEFFYEWQAVEGKKVKQPWCIALEDGEPFAFGAVWESWTSTADPGAESLTTCAIITTEPNAVMAPIHARMPLIIKPADYDIWLDGHTSPDKAQALIRPFDGYMRSWRVSTRVNKITHGGGENIEPIGEPIA